MNEKENMILQGLQLAVDRLTLEIVQQRQEAENSGRFDDLPEWIDLEQAVALKRGIKARGGSAPGAGGAPITFYRQKPFLQPCCGLNCKMVGGRRCWKKEDVIVWLAVTDENLKSYADIYRVTLPDTYEKRGKRPA